MWITTGACWSFPTAVSRTAAIAVSAEATGRWNGSTRRRKISWPWPAGVMNSSMGPSRCNPGSGRTRPEQTKETYQRWYNAGAHRYLLRIESSNPKLYRTLHPQDGRHKWKVRKACLEALAEIGYQVGTGVMIGLPGQTLEDLADDILFYKNQNIAMIGMGPYVVHHNTPLGKKVCEAGLDSQVEKERRLRLSINMVAVTRLFLKDVNIAATTAMQTLHPQGREMALKAGANILMPLVTLPQFRSQYQLYDNKPCLEDGQEQCRNCLSARVASVGDTVGWGQWGDSPHFFNNLK